MPHPTHIVAVAGLVEDKNGNVLLIKSPARGWEFTGGQVEVGESIEEAVLREILEESGITATIRSLVGIYSNVGGSPTKVMLDFICDYVSGSPTTSSESTEVIWVPKNEALQYITTPAYRFRFEKMLNWGGKVNYCSYVTKPEFKVLSDRIV